MSQEYRKKILEWSKAFPVSPSEAEHVYKMLGENDVLMEFVLNLSMKGFSPIEIAFYGMGAEPKARVDHLIGFSSDPSVKGVVK